jgi:molecular chaperone GrpE
MTNDNMHDPAELPRDHVPDAAEALDELLPAEGSDAEGGSGSEAGAALEPEPAPEELGIELPDDPDAAQALLLRELAEARQEAGEYLETLQRIAADFDNFRKRVERDQAENVQRASQRLIEALLPTLDTLDAALAFEAQTDGEAKMLDGVRGTHTQLLETLAREGFGPIDAAGHPFDPSVHEAVAGPTEQGDGDLVVATELRRGYVMRGRVIRPSLVTVEHA